MRAQKPPATLFVDEGLHSRCNATKLVLFKNYFNFQLFRPGVLFFIYKGTTITANEIKVGLQIATANSLSPSCVGCSVKAYIQIHINLFLAALYFSCCPESSSEKIHFSTA